ncbi:hypothetical protein C8F04DRAFT_1105089 [Mycena alexandri]|uniref:Ricin B lectin domain-containing protein n=1 Tax=Mycena alexandri TaxID=1745969 RepID=A0AAD6S137_9AGAR|nr:hypothetical protein C8F04DRAFT_1151329 [Mycena alexandri]KAJ7033080.1 hypothetical protein C8F04DRAFT_1105089 [Mycena alexandri]
MINLTAIAFAGTLFSITDFQGHVLDDTEAFATNLNPVVGNIKVIPANPDQQWSFLATITPNEFNIQHALTQKFLSYAGAPNGSTTWAQTVIDGTNPMAFNLALVSPSPETFNIVDAKTGLALTAWSAPVRTSITPVTYEPLQAGAAEQIWTLA